MEKYYVEKDFILQAHEAACTSWKKKLERKFPEVFVPEKVEVQYIEEQVTDWNTRQAGERQYQSYFFRRGQLVRTIDNSYNESFDTGENDAGEKGYFQKKAVIVDFIQDHWQDALLGSRVTLNLLIRFDDGALYYYAPNCVTPI